MKKTITILIVMIASTLLENSALAWGGSNITCFSDRCDCTAVIWDFKDLRNYSFMGRVDTRVLKKRLGSEYADFESKCRTDSRLNDISYNNDSCDEDFVIECTSDFRFTLYYAALHQKANEKLLERHEKKVNKSCTTTAASLEGTIKAAMGADEPVKKEKDILVDAYSEWRCPHWYSCGYYDVNEWETVSARSTWANEHICTVGVDELDSDGRKRAAYWFKDKGLMTEKYDGDGKVTVPATAVIEDIYKEERAQDNGAYWCNSDGTSKCVIRKKIEVENSTEVKTEEIDSLMVKYKPQDYLNGLIWPFEIDVVAKSKKAGCSKEHRIYLTDDVEHPLVVRECAKYLDITDYHPAVEDAGQWDDRLESLLKAQTASNDVPPIQTEKEGYYVCYGDGNSCLVQGYYRNLEAVVKVHIKDEKWRFEKLPAIKDGKGTKEDITAGDGVFYYGISADDTDKRSVVRIIPSEKPESAISCKINGKEVTEAEHVYPLKPSKYEQITIAADASNVEVTCTITLTGSLQFSSDSEMSLWLDVYEDDPAKYQCAKNNSDYSPGKDGCEEVGMECLWCSYHNDALDFAGKPVNTEKPQELAVSINIPKKDIPWGKVAGLLSSQKIKINGGASTSVAMNNGAMHRFTFGQNVAFVEEGHFICEDGTYGESCDCDGDDLWDTAGGVCVPNCGAEAKWNVDKGKCECLASGLVHNSYSDKCYDPNICDNIKNGAKYNEEADLCACSNEHMMLKGSECACDATKGWVSDGDLGCKCPSGYVVKDGACVPDDNSSVCSKDSDCNDNELCKEGICVKNEPEPLGGGCKINSDCGTGMLCSATGKCECDINSNYYPPFADAKTCEYREPTAAVGSICEINGGQYLQERCIYNKSEVACITGGGAWEGNECATNDEPAKSGGCSLVAGAPVSGDLGIALAYLTMLGSILLVRIRKNRHP